MNRIITLFIIFCLSLSSLTCEDGMLHAARKKNRTETKESISKRQQKNKKEIKETNNKIKTNAREVTKQLNELNLVTAEIEECKARLKGINGTIITLDRQIKVISDSVDILDNRLNTMSDKYARAIRKMQTRNSVDKSDFAFIFSAKSFSEAFYRSRSIKQFSIWRKKKADELTAMKTTLDGRRKVLEEKKSDRMVLLDSLSVQMAILDDKKEESDRLVEQLRREGTQLKNILAQKQKEADDLDRELNRLIQIEQERIRKAEEERQREERIRQEKAEQERLLKEQQERERKETEANKKQKNKPTAGKDKKKNGSKGDNTKKESPKPPTGQQSETNTPPTPEKKDSNSAANQKQESEDKVTEIAEFSKAKGRLPYPVKGKIVKKFGRQQHPDLKHVVTDNPGIDIETSPKSSVRSVFNGYVSDIFRLPGYNTIVMVRHGNYLTIYANLGSISIKKGDKVKQGEEIGTVFTDENDDSRSILHFEIRNERSKEDPELWLK